MIINRFFLNAFLCLLIVSVLSINISAETNFCCIIENECMTGETYLEDMGISRENAQTMCIEENGEFIGDRPCSQVNLCVQGCCIFYDDSRMEWTQNFGVTGDDCRVATNSFFDSEVGSEVQCEALFQDKTFRIFFDVRDNQDNPIQVDRERSFIQEIGGDLRCSLDYVPSSEYNYGVDCDGRGTLGFGSYIVSLSTTVDGNFFSTDKIINVNDENIFSLVFDLADDSEQVTDISGQVYQYITDTDGSLVQSEREVSDALVNVVGLNIQTTTDGSGRFTLENVPIDDQRRTITVFAQGFHIWGDDVTIYPDLNFVDNPIYLATDDDAPTGKICCPNSLGCLDGESGGSCFAGSGRHGIYCDGQTPSDACNVPAPFCCSSVALCPSNQRNTAGGCRVQGCNVPCLQTSECVVGRPTNVGSPCLCGDEIITEGYCCEDASGKTIYDSPCENHGQEISVMVLGKDRNGEFSPVSGATVFFMDYNLGMSFNSETGPDGMINELKLPNGIFKSNAFATGFTTPRNEKEFRVSDDSFEIILSEFLDVSDSSERDSQQILQENYGVTIDSSPNLIYVLDHSLPNCVWGDSEITFASGTNVHGQKSIRINWDFDDCLELMNFRIERRELKYTRTGNDVSYDLDDSGANWKLDSDESRDDFVEVGRVPAGRDFFIDTNVRWSNHVPVVNELPAIYDGGNSIRVAGENTQEVWVYEYKIRPVFTTVVGGAYPYDRDGIRVMMGDEVCEGRSGMNSLLCGYDSNQEFARGPIGFPTLSDAMMSDSSLRSTLFRALRTLRLSCNDNNLIEFTEPSCFDDVTFSIPFEGNRLYTGPVCTGPNEAGMLECSERAKCRGDPILESPSSRGAFGMLERAFHTISPDQNTFCYGEPQGTRFENACVLQPDSTISDRCVYCEEILSCVDYTSEEACGIDNCMVGRSGESNTPCTWINTSLSNYGEGVCVPGDIRPSENYCSLISRNNLPFESNFGWNNDLCSQLGDCFSSFASGCVSCDTINNCGDYHDEYECIGDPSKSQNISVSYPIPELYGGHQSQEWQNVRDSCGFSAEDSLYNRSNDGCGLGTCRWTTNGCIRDANSDGERDLRSEVNIDDNTPPELSALMDSNFIFSHNSGHSDLVFISNKNLFARQSEHYDFANNRFGFRFCIDQDDSCCPSLPRDESKINSGGYILEHDRVEIRNLLERFSTHFEDDGIYYIRYVSQDENHNIAPLESIEIVVDRTPPNISISMSESLIPNDGDDLVRLRFDVLSLEESPIPDAGTEFIKCEFDLLNIMAGRSSEEGDHLQSGAFMPEHVVEYVVESGLYLFTAHCKDSASNDVYKERFIRADGFDNLNLIYPPIAGAVPDEDYVHFELHTEVESECRLYWYYGGIESSIFDFSTDAAGLVHEIPAQINLNEIYEGPVYHEQFGIYCIENIYHCTGNGLQCTDHSDCAGEGSCQRKEYDDPVTFVRDGVPPVTTIKPFGIDDDGREDISYRKEMDSRGISGHDYILDGVYFYNNNISIDFSCEGVAPDSTYPNLMANCKPEDSTYYCVSHSSGNEPGSENYCNQNDLNWRSYDQDPNIVEDRSFTICYYSVDEVGNKEDTRCSAFFISRTIPSIDLSIDTQYVYDDSFVTVSPDNTFLGYINANLLDSHKLHYRTSDGVGRLLLESSRQGRSVTPESYLEQSQSNSLYFSGDLPSFARINSLGSNELRLEVEDRYGNKAVKTIYVYYDIKPPIIRDYEINNELMAKNATYNQDLNFRFRLDDVFWTNEISRVSANVYAYDVGPFASDFEMGWTDLDYVRTIVPDSDITRSNLTNEVEDYINNLFFYGTDFSDDAIRDGLDEIAVWKEYSFSIDIDRYFNEDLRLNDIGVGQYILEILAIDVTGQEMREYILFNITDPNDPIISMRQPPVYRESSSSPGDPRVRITNNVNQEFVVETNQPSFCFFDLGYIPSQNNPMREDENREIHRYILDGFEPFFDRFPITISCTSHGIDLHSEHYSLIFDRRPLTLAMESSRGELVPPSVNKDHIREYQLDFEQRRYGELKPLIKLQDQSADRIIECSYTCASPNSMCMEIAGTFPGALSANPSFSPKIREEFGDYMYTIVCNDQAGNIARARDLVFSVRDRGAIQNLYVLDNSPYPSNEETHYTDVIDFGLSTTIASFCSIIFTEGGIDNVEFSDKASLSHSRSINMTEHSGRDLERISFKYRCEQSTDRRNVVETEEVSISIITDFDEIADWMFNQNEVFGQYIPVFSIRELPEGISHIEYSLNDETFSDSVRVPYTKSLVLMDLTSSDDVFVRGVYSSGHKTSSLNLELDESTIYGFDEIQLESARDGPIGQTINPSVDLATGTNMYALQSDRIGLTLRLGSELSRIRALVNGNSVSSSLYRLTNIVETNYFVPGQGYHDIFIFAELDVGGSTEYRGLHLPVSRHDGAPVIESISPRFLGRDRKLTVEVSRPAECSVSYPSASSDRQLTIRSEGASIYHEFIIDDLKVSGRRHEATHVTVYCNDFESAVAEKDHLVQVALTPPKILDINSDNSIFNGSSRNSDYIFTSVRNEDVHIIVNTDEYSRCTYEDEDGNVNEFVDYFLPNLYPHTSLKSEEGVGRNYIIRCENEAEIPANNEYSVTVYNNPNAPLYLHDPYPTDVTNNPYPKIEIYTFRDASCAVDIHEEAEDTNIFFRVLGNIFRTSSRMESELVGHRYRHTVDVSTADMHRLMGLRMGQIYRVTIQCQYDGDSASKDLSFIYSPDADPRPIIYIE